MLKNASYMFFQKRNKTKQNDYEKTTKPINTTGVEP